MIDLHVHTKISDNSLTTSEVIKLARDRGITHIGITDHDTTKGLNEAIDLGKEIGVDVVPGIEISAYDYRRNKRAHILGLYVEPGHPALEFLCAPMIRRRKINSFKRVLRLMAVGYDISWEDVLKYEGGTGVFKQHIMHALMEKGYCKNICGDLYKALFRRSDSLKGKGIAHIPLAYIDVLAAIRTVREAGGIAVLAHPGTFKNYDAIDEWAESGLEGIEVFHPGHSPEDIELSLQHAKKYRLIVTGGSDFHGLYGEIPVEPGCRELGNECIDDLMKRKKLSS